MLHRVVRIRYYTGFSGSDTTHCCQDEILHRVIRIRYHTGLSGSDIASGC